MADDDDQVEQTLLVIKECFVYRIPPRATTSGYRAGDWDVSNFIWSGKLLVKSVGDTCLIILQDPNTGDLFATCPVTPGSVESVNDSSRYFVLRIDDGKGHHAFVGMGFTERSEAFDFNAALQDHQKYIKQRKEAKDSVQRLENAPKLDLSLKEGQTIRVNIKTNKPNNSSNNNQFSSNNSNNSGGFGMLPPPPGSKKTTTTSFTNQQSFNNDAFNNNNNSNFGFSNANTSTNANNADFWGDFTGSNNSQQQSNNNKPNSNNNWPF